MCQYKQNCKNFLKNPKNTSNCMILCTRNPLINYELSDNYVPMKQQFDVLDSNFRGEVELEFSPVKVIKEGEDFNIASIKKELAKIQEDKSIPAGRKRDAIQDILIKKGVLDSTASEELPTTNLPPPKAGDIKETGKRAEQMEDVAKAVEENTMEETDVTGWKAPRRRGKGYR